MAMPVEAVPTTKPTNALRATVVADRLGVSVSTVWRYVKQKKLTPTKLSEKVTIFRESEVESLINGTL